MVRAAVLLVIAALGMPVHSQTSVPWQQTAGPEGGGMRAVAVSGDVMLAVTYGGQVVRRNGGVWEAVGSLAALRFYAYDGTFFAATSTGLVRSTDNGSTWIPGQFTTAPDEIVADGSALYALVSDTLFRSDDGGVIWNGVHAVVPGADALIVDGDTIVVASFFGLLPERSTDGGQNFSPLTNGLPSSVFCQAAVKFGNDFFVDTGIGGMYRSTDGGASWHPRRDGLPQYGTNSFYTTARLAAAPGALYAVTNSTVYRYTGSVWSAASPMYRVLDTYANGDELVAGCDAGLWISTDAGTHWDESNHGVVATTATMMARIDGDVYALIGGRLARTPDAGDTWTYPSALAASRLVAHNGNLFAATTSGVSRSTDNGMTWAPANNGITEYLPDIKDIAATDDAVYASFYYIQSLHGTSSWFSGGVFRSTDEGDSWTAVNAGLPTNEWQIVVPVYRVAANGPSLFIQTAVGVYRSTNGGGNWVPANGGIPANSWVQTLYATPSVVVCGTNHGIFRFDGSAWTDMNAGLPQPNGYYPYANGFVQAGDALFMSTNLGVFQHDGAAWAPYGTGIPAATTGQCVTVVNGSVLAGVSSLGVWRAPLTPVGIGGGGVVPAAATLGQNFPNPFNPSTEIRFTATRRGWVRLKVYDALGREMAALVNGILEPGPYTVRWDAKNHASGVYFYRLQAGATVLTKKMLLVK